MDPVSSRFSLPAVWRPRVALMALAVGVSISRGFAEEIMPTASVVANAPQVGAAPIVDKPLPPPADNEAMGTAPSAKHVWVPGHFHWEDGSYIWESGRWELPPNEGDSWVQPRWETRPNGYTLIEGGWRARAPMAMAVSTPPPAPAMVINGPGEPPPPPPQEVRIERAGADLVWVPGYYVRRGGRYVWIEGRWDRPPHRGMVWVEPRWDRRGRDYSFVEGYWREGSNVSVSVGPGPGRDPRGDVRIVAAPPPPRRENHYASPGPGYVWLGGYWSWIGNRYVWISGHWDQPPRGRRSWEEPRWENRGGNYIFVEGRWR